MDDDELTERLNTLQRDVRSRRYWGDQHDPTGFESNIPRDEDDIPSETFDMLESRLRQLQRRTVLDTQRSRAATKLQSRFRGNRIRTLKRRNRETLDRMRHNVEQMKRDPYLDEARSRFFAPDDSIIHKYTRHGDITELIMPRVAIIQLRNELSKLVEIFNHLSNRGRVSRNKIKNAQFMDSVRMDFDRFIIKYLELPLDVKNIIIDSSIILKLDKSALELYDSSEEEVYDEDTNSFNEYVREINGTDKLYKLTQILVENLQSIINERDSYRYTIQFVEFLISNYH